MLVLITVFLLVVVFVLVILYHANPQMRDPYGDDWYQEEIDRTTIDFIKQTETVDGKIKICSYHFTGFDHDIEIENRSKKQKQFPFVAVKVVAETRKNQYFVFVFVDSDGYLQIEKYEKKSNFNPFL